MSNKAVAIIASTTIGNSRVDLTSLLAAFCKFFI